MYQVGKMTDERIENLQDVLSPHIGSDKKLTDVEITRLTAPGENYGSIMLKVNVKLKNDKDGSEEEIHTVVKKIPPTEFARKVFNIQVSVKNEMAMYDTMVPTLQEFQREHGVHEFVDYLAKFYGGRLNLDRKSETVDEDAVLILENLQASGYINVDRHVGFNLDTTELILKDLASFHAVPLALKLQKPELFDEKFRPYLVPFVPPEPPRDGETGETIGSVIVEMLQESDKCIPYISKVKKILDRPLGAPVGPVREPFSTVTHGDMWVNNIMLKFQNSRPVKNKFVDFQVCDYKSPATDLFFLLFTSVQQKVLEDHFDNLIKFYHMHFISHLEKLNCNTMPFRLHNFLEEMQYATNAELAHTAMMTLFIVFGKKGGPSGEFNPEGKPDFIKMRKTLSLDAKEKIRFMVQLCGKKGWL